jgi:tRNA threonylcarbamoyl adenosine modification protein (Sua5/YciO/YrdC/YwlC family)
LVIYPTDTLYGMGCSIRNKQAIQKIYQIKGKSKFAPTSLICSSIQQASNYVRISNYTFKILKRCLPGPFTFILEATREIPKLMLSRRKEIGIRIPDSKVVLELVQELENPIINSSINLTGEGLINDPKEIMELFKNNVEIILDGGILLDPIPSTVVKIRDDVLEVQREGKGDLDKIKI